MAKNNHKIIGNENFKIWLKTLDPAARVERMSAIAKTQSSAGLKGSSIKASLAQLSQRCFVMLMRLTDKEIQFYSRTPSVKRLKSKSKTNKLDIHSKQSPNPASQYRTNELYQNTSNLFTKHEKTPSSTLKPYSNKTKLKESRCGKRPKNSRLEERYKELFGEDTSVVNNKAPKPLKTHTSRSENKVNNGVSTMINVNIISSSSNNEADNTLVNKRTHEDNIIDGAHETYNNRLRIDVSLSNKGYNFVEARSVSKKRRNPKECVMSSKGAKKQRVHNSSKCNETAETNKGEQIMSDTLVLSDLHNDNSEDDPVQELWKIFGMESPTDRSENIIKSLPNPQSLNLKDITNNENNVLNLLPIREQENEALTKQNAVSTPDLISSKETHTNKNVSENVENNSAGHGNINRVSFVSENVETTSADRGNVNNVSYDKEPFCKISETFSLAKLNPGILYDEGLTSNFVKEDHAHFVKTKGLSNGSGVQVNKNGESGIIETISLCDDDEEEDFVIISSSKNQNNTVSQKLNETQSKIGTIRVKNLGLLLNPQKVPDTNNTAETSNSQVQNGNEQSTSNQEDDIGDKSVEERFFDFYKQAFDELLEAKVLKLGELLHLAVSDEIRRKERIKRAEQLSSSDLIYEEIQRANKDFNEMMKVRGSEFAPLVDGILKQFDKGAKVTLFFTLFLRIFERAKEIDVENGSHVVAAKEVIGTMLVKTAHNDISLALLCSTDEFLKQLRVVNMLLIAFRTKNSSQNNDISRQGILSPHAVSTSRTPVTKNKPQEVINRNSSFSKNFASSEVANIATHIPIVSTSAPSVESVKLRENVTVQLNSKQSIAHQNVVTILDPTDVSLCNTLPKKPILNHSLEHVETMQPQKTTKNAAISQAINSAKPVSSTLDPSSNQPNSTVIVPRSNAYTKSLSSTNPSPQSHTLMTHTLRNINNPVSEILTPSTVTVKNVHYLSLQKADKGRKLTNPEQSHLAINRRETELNHVNSQQNEQLFSRAHNSNSSSATLLGLFPSTSLTPVCSNETPTEPTKAANGQKRRSSTSRSKIASSGIASPAAHGVSTIRQHAANTQPSITLVDYPPSNYLNVIDRQPTSNFTQYNSANTSTSSPDFNNMTRKTPETNYEPQLGSIETETIDPIQGHSALKRLVDLSVRRITENLPSNTNFNALQTQPMNSSNQNISTMNSSNQNISTFNKSMSNNVVVATKTNRRSYSLKSGVFNGQASGTTDGQPNGVSVSNQILPNARRFSSSIVENPSSSNLPVHSHLINATGNVPQYNSTTGYAPSPILASMLKNTPGSSKVPETQHPVTVTNTSTTMKPQEQNISVSTNSTIKANISLNSRSENIDSSSINISNLLKEQSDSISRRYNTPYVPTPVLNNTSLRMYPFAQQEKAPIYSGYTNSIAGSQKTTVSASQVGSTTEAYCESQAIQSSKSSTTSESQFMSSHPTPVTMAPTLFPESVIEPKSSLPTVNSFANRQEPFQLTSSSSTSEHPGTTSNLPSSSPRKLSFLKSIQPDLTQPTVAPQQSLPTSSHCHPFIKRMPISGKMKMFFGNK